jgi:hypothetical protein
MTATEIARAAVRDVRQAATFLSPQVVENLARARVAMHILAMDNSTPANVRMMRLEDAIRAIPEFLFPED